MGFWVEVGKASVYQTLRRLERDGSVGGRSQEGPEGPDRRVYRITRAGRERLQRGLSERAAALEPYETDGGLALGFIHLLPAADARAVVDEREAAVRDLLDALKTERTRTAADKGPGRSVSTAMLTVRRRSPRRSSRGSKAFRTELEGRRSGGGSQEYRRNIK
jgi:DNA-binding PadR family transcriptional regulator